MFFALAAAAFLMPELPDADETHAYRTVEGEALGAYVYRPEGEGTGAALLMLHGGGWSVGSPAWTSGVARLAAEHGVVGIPVQYRLSRGEVTPVDAFEDVCAALSWTRENAEELGVDPDRVGFYGVSAGGHLAALTATAGCADGTAPPALLALYSPALNMRADGWFIRKLQGEAEPEAMSPLHNVGEDLPPTLIISGEEDTLTPHRFAEAFCEEAASHDRPCAVEPFADAGHLLTRNLENQESNFNPTDEDRARARALIVEFLRGQSFARDTE